MNTKKIIGIYLGDAALSYSSSWDEKTVIDKGMGGSETWACCVAIEFERMGYHAIIFGNPEFSHFSKSGVEYVCVADFYNVCEYINFDLMIFSRTTDFDLDRISAKRMCIVCQDEYNYGLDRFVLEDSRIDKIFVMSETHKKTFASLFPNVSGKLLITANGVDFSLYDNVDFYGKKNMMVWSSLKYRGLNRFIKYVYPIVAKEISDFMLIVCSYDDRDEYLFKEKYGDTIKFVGKLGKAKLAELQKESKVWAYPNIGIDENYRIFHETFCITAIENAAAGNAIICFGGKDGIDTTLSGYSHFLESKVDENMIYDSSIYEDCVAIANKIIDVLKDDGLRLSMVNETLQKVANYTWENAAKGLVEYMEVL